MKNNEVINIDDSGCGIVWNVYGLFGELVCGGGEGDMKVSGEGDPQFRRMTSPYYPNS